jgi:hypothetical protein
MELVYIKNNVKRENGKIVCPHNPEGVRCKSMHCGSCGWHPAVAKKRMERMAKGAQA